MNTLRNKVQLIGRLGAKADYKVLDNGNALARISLATNEVYKNAKGERIEDTTWHQVVAWGKLAEIIHKYTDKGTEIAIEGKLINRSYNDAQGEKKYVTEVQAKDVVLLGEKNMSTK